MLYFCYNSSKKSLTKYNRIRFNAETEIYRLVYLKTITTFKIKI